jgi:ABC-type nitrate/sulfonate/bicarbonate transport system substrate-binding protein
MLYVAENQGYFTKNGLNVTFVDYPTSEAGFNDLAIGEVDFVQSAEYPIVRAVFDNKDVRVISTIDKADVSNIIGRRDKGIENPSDFEGKKIGVGKGTIREFYLGRYLNIHGINIDEVTMVYLSLQESVDAIVNGTIDAVVMPDTVWYNQVMSKLGSNGVAFPIQEGQPIFTQLVTRTDYLANNSQKVTKLLTALYQAEIFILNNPKEAEEIVQNRLNLTSADVGWNDHRFSLSLDLPLVTAMRDEAQWIINNNATSQTEVPDFTNYIYTDALKLVKPYSVTINVGS